MTKIHNVNKKNRGNKWCGPAAMSAVLGIDTDQAAATLREVTGRDRITSTYDHWMNQAFNKHGVKMTRARDEIAPKRRETLTAWAKRTHAERGDRIFLVSAGRHWRVHQGWNQVCGIVMKVGSMAHAHKPRCITRTVYELDVSQAKKSVLLSNKKLGTRQASRRAEYRARKLIKALDLELDIDHHSGMAPYWISPGKSWTKDPREDEHFADDWAGVLELAEYYSEHAHLREEAA